MNNDLPGASTSLDSIGRFACAPGDSWLILRFLSVDMFVTLLFSNSSSDGAFDDDCMGSESAGSGHLGAEIEDECSVCTGHGRPGWKRRGGHAVCRELPDTDVGFWSKEC